MKPRVKKKNMKNKNRARAMGQGIGWPKAEKAAAKIRVLVGKLLLLM